jgi:hypothetical protein
MPLKSQDIVTIVNNLEFRERVRVLLRRYAAVMVRIAYPPAGGTGTAQQIAAAEDTVRTARKITGNEGKLRDICYDLLNETTQPMDASNRGDELTDATITTMLTDGVLSLWTRSENVA